jgi:hypothetical protein
VDTPSSYLVPRFDQLWSEPNTPHHVLFRFASRRFELYLNQVAETALPTLTHDCVDFSSVPVVNFRMSPSSTGSLVSGSNVLDSPADLRFVISHPIRTFG